MLTLAERRLLEEYNQELFYLYMQQANLVRTMLLDDDYERFAPNLRRTDDAIRRVMGKIEMEKEHIFRKNAHKYR